MRYERKSRRPGEPAAQSEPTTTTSRQTGCTESIAVQLRRRRAASWRMVPLDCGCPTGPHAELLACLCTFPPLTDHQLDGWRDAARDVLATGHMPLVPIEVRRALWRRPPTASWPSCCMKAVARSRRDG